MKNFKAGRYVDEGKSFHPEKINRQWVVTDMEVVDLLSQANRQLGRLDMCFECVSNADRFVGMYIVKEAIKSGEIEGIKIGIEDALLDKADVDEDKIDAWEAVQNYISTLNAAMEHLNTSPFSSGLIREVHKMLLRGRENQHKLPGEFRSGRNWMGESPIYDAKVVAPTFNLIGEYMSDMEEFVHSDEHYFPDLLKIALIHYQFGMVRPFLDSNGRVGRLIITLYLVEKGMLKKPVLTLSDFFESDRACYYNNLVGVREKHDITQWFKFFLAGVIETAKRGIDIFNGILRLQNEIEHKIQGLGTRSDNAAQLVTYLFQKPIVDARAAEAVTQLSLPSVYRLIGELRELKILEEITGKKRNRLFACKDYLKLFE